MMLRAATFVDYPLCVWQRPKGRVVVDMMCSCPSWSSQMCIMPYNWKIR